MLQRASRFVSREKTLPPAPSSLPRLPNINRPVAASKFAPNCARPVGVVQPASRRKDAKSRTVVANGGFVGGSDLAITDDGERKALRTQFPYVSKHTHTLSHSHTLTHSVYAHAHTNTHAQTHTHTH
jgi:hypothetical protein